MPWRLKPMKDVGDCDKPWGAVYRALIHGCPNGKTLYPSWGTTPAWIYRAGRGNRVNWNISVTRGEENKSDSLSSGERNGKSLNRAGVKALGVASSGLWDLLEGTSYLHRVTKLIRSRSTWKGTPKRVTAPYAKRWDLWVNSRVTPDPGKPAWICQDHLIRLSTHRRPIVNKYREGKVKSTPGGEWNRTWNRWFTIS